MTHSLTPRRAAQSLLAQVLGEGAMLSDAMGQERFQKLAGPEKARAQRLATETLRGLERADRLLANHMQKMPPLPILNLLRLATWELAAGEAAHGVVNDYVTLAAKDRRHGKLKGLVNAVLRKIAGEAGTAWDKMRTPRLPDWLREPLLMAYGPDRMAAIEAAHFAGAPLDLTAKGDAAALAERLGGTLLPTGSVRLAEAGRVSALAGYEEGDWWVQDAAAALPVRLLGDVTGLEVLDLCAAPGGKTLQLAAGGATVTAVDISARRLERVRENLARCRLTAEVRQADAFEVAGQWDAVLLDAPCSATGTIRRHPDLPHAKDGGDIGALIDLQAAMLDHALTLLKPGGRLVFCTCSLIPDEGEVQVEEALARHPGLAVEAVEGVAGLDPDWRTEEGGLRLTPDLWADRGGLDGFYMAVLRKPA